MTLVSHQHEFVFLKTVKTAGTSVEVALEPLCAPKGHVPSHVTPEIVSQQGIIGGRQRFAPDARPTWYNHMPAGEVRELLGTARWDRYRRFACLRNPFDKVVSHFWFVNREADQLSQADQTAAFRGFVARTWGSADIRERTVDWRVSHIDGTLILTDLIRYETLVPDTDAALVSFGLPALGAEGFPRLKTGLRGADKRAVAEWYDTVTADIIRRTFDWMFDLGAYSTDPRDARRSASTQVSA